MPNAICECPRCRRQITVSWDWDALETVDVDDDDGEVVTDSDCLDATRVAYQRNVRCPHCMTRLRVEHELVPRFYASKERQR
jgi:hypothetical protein